ncbi:alpha/beta hydrolase [Maricaulis sp. CAU 1757]
MSRLTRFPLASMLSALTLAVAVAPQSVAASQPDDSGEDRALPCALDSAPVCPVAGAITAAEARARLGAQDNAYWLDEGLVHVAARRDPQIGSVEMCCVFHTSMERLSDDGLWGMSYEVARLDEAVLAFWPLPPVSAEGDAFTARPVYRGPNARPAPPRTGAWSEHAEAHLLPSTVYGHDRRVSLYLPPGVPPADGYPTIFVADGGRVHTLAPIAEALAASCQAQPVLMVGLWPGEEHGAPAVDGLSGPASDARSREYLWNAHPVSFDLHQRWLIEDLLPLAQDRGGSARRQDRMTFGASSGAAWALSTGLLQADRIAHVAGASLGWESAREAGQPAAPINVMISAGLYEPGFHADSRGVVAALQADGIAARFVELVSGHGPVAYEMLFADAVKAAFPADPDCVPDTP